MKYKIGDRIEIRNMEFHPSAERDIAKFGRFATIERIHNKCYILKEFGSRWNWQDYHIKGLAPVPRQVPEPEVKTTRFELMDL